MKTKHPIEIIDLRHQFDHIIPKNIQIFHEYGTDPDKFRLYVIIIRQREIELISVGNKKIEVKVSSTIDNL